MLHHLTKRELPNPFQCEKLSISNEKQKDCVWTLFWTNAILIWYNEKIPKRNKVNVFKTRGIHKVKQGAQIRKLKLSLIFLLLRIPDVQQGKLLETLLTVTYSSKCPLNKLQKNRNLENTIFGVNLKEKAVLGNTWLKTDLRKLF